MTQTIYYEFTGLTGGTASVCRVSYQTGTTPTFLTFGISISGAGSTATGNIVTFNNTNANALDHNGIIGTVGCEIVGNRVSMAFNTTGTSSYATGIYGGTDAIISDNSLKVINSNNSNVTYGIRVFTDRNKVSGNSIEMNNHANDTGIYLGVGADNNQVNDNITYNVGTSVDDTAGGAGNTVVDNKDV